MNATGPEGWLVTGAGGMLGRELVGLLTAADMRVTGLTRMELDITERTAVEKAITTLRPSVVVNCAGWTQVDDAETAETAARRVNGDAVAQLATACRTVDAKLIQLSTDYVFAGDATTPYPEDAAPAPKNAYGRSKLVGERNVLDLLPNIGYVVRTAWMYGAYGRNFIQTMIQLERSKKTVDVVDDQRGQPTWTRDVAAQIIALVCADAPAGIYHATNAGEATWHELAREVFTLLGADPARVRPTTTDRFPRPAPRPPYGVLGHGRWERIGLRPMRHWRDALHQALPGLRAQLPVDASR
jgi:dTDP-4-dehydrorhamnose reductase